MDDAVASAEGEDDEALLVDAEPISPRAATASPSHSPELPAADAEAHQAGKDESKRGKASDCCALCTEPFTPWGSSLNLSSFVRKAAPRRSKHNCRICARPVCEIEPSREGAETTGCCRKTRVPKRLWHRSLASLRKEDTKVRRQDCELCARTRANGEPDDCSALHSPSPTDPLDADASKDSLGASVAADTASCICAEGWLCNDCEENVSNFKRASPLDDMQAAADAGDLQALHVCASLPLVKWMLTLDCEESDDAQHFAGLSERLARVTAYLESGLEPRWPRPAIKPRSYTSQVGYSALEALNFAAGGKVAMALKGARLAFRGLAFSEYILSEEFIVAWRLLLEQLGEFVDTDTKAEADKEGNTGQDRQPSDPGAAVEPAGGSPAEGDSQGGNPSVSTVQAQTQAQNSASYRVVQGAVVVKQRTAVAFDLCKRFYYYSLHLTLQRLSFEGGGGAAGETPVTEDDEERAVRLLDEACQYLHMTALLYDSSDNVEKRPSMDAEAEAAWFLQKSVAADGYVLLDHMHEAGQDMCHRSKTFGAKHPAFAILLHRERQELVIAVRGSRGKQDHLIDLDFQYDTILPSDHEGASGEWQGHVHRGMLKSARFILHTRGLRAVLAMLPSTYKIRLVGHSLGAGTVALMTGLLKADPELSGYDIQAHAFGTPACVSPALSVLLQPYVTSVCHREDMVPRLSFSNLVRLRSHFNRPEEKEWCSQQIAIDYENFWSYVGWSADEKKQREMREAEEMAAAEAAANSQSDAGAEKTLPAVMGAVCKEEMYQRQMLSTELQGRGVEALNHGKTFLGDLVVPGRVVHLREDAATGCYKAVVTDHSDADLQWIKVQLRAIDDHYIKSYLQVIRGLKLRARIPRGESDVTRRFESAANEDGSWRACSICERDVCDMLIFKSDAHRAKAIKHCMQCGRVCCMDCAPAADKMPDLSRELWATRRTADRRIVLPELGTLEPQRLCLLCHAHRDNRLV